MTDILSEEQVAEAMKGRTHWKQRDGAIVRELEAPGFLEGIAIVDEVAQAAEAATHHPDIDVRYTTLTFALVSHDAGGLTSKDFDLANTIDEIAARHLSQ